MNTSDLQFNIIYTPGTVRYLTPFILTLLKWSNCRYRIVANGCSPAECELLTTICALDDRLELLIMPEQRMVPHGETLNFLHERTQSDYFCFMDSDILAVGPFMDDFRGDLNDSDLFSSCLPLWHNDRDITIPDSFQHLHGIHAYTESGQTIACDYFVVYDNRAFTESRTATGVGLAVCGWNDIAAENQKIVREMGQARSDYDSGKLLTLLMAARGARINFRQSDNLNHIGGFTEVGALKGAMLYSRGRADTIANALPGALGSWLIYLADAWYAWQRGSPDNSRRENLSLVSRMRRRTTTARYFYLLIIGLMDDKAVPAVPKLGDAIAEQRLADVSRKIATLIADVRNNPGPWQDKTSG
jgi:hypothetical protein